MGSILVLSCRICYTISSRCRKVWRQSDCLSGNGKGVCAMNTLEVLTLVLVIFAVLTYLDNHNHKKQQLAIDRKKLSPTGIGDSSCVVTHLQYHLFPLGMRMVQYLHTFYIDYKALTVKSQVLEWGSVMPSHFLCIDINALHEAKGD